MVIRGQLIKSAEMNNPYLFSQLKQNSSQEDSQKKSQYDAEKFAEAKLSGALNDECVSNIEKINTKNLRVKKIKLAQQCIEFILKLQEFRSLRLNDKKIFNLQSFNISVEKVKDSEEFIQSVKDIENIRNLNNNHNNHFYLTFISFKNEELYSEFREEDVQKIKNHLSANLYEAISTINSIYKFFEEIYSKAPNTPGKNAGTSTPKMINLDSLNENITKISNSLKGVTGIERAKVVEPNYIY